MAFSTSRNRVLSLLGEQFEASIPQFKSYTLDYQMVVYACKDLEACLKTRWRIEDNKTLFEKLESLLNDDPEQLRLFLGFWTGIWLEKWRERVKVLSTEPKAPPFYMERIKKAKKLYLELEYRKELKQMVSRKLSCQNEVCMIDMIAENLIIEEIAKRTENTEENKDIPRLKLLNPIDMLANLSYRISRLPKEKGPMVYLNIKPYLL